MPQVVFENIVNIIEAFTAIVFITLYLGRKYQGARSFFGFIIAFVVSFAEITIVNYVTIFETYEAYLSLIIYFLYALLFLCGDWTQKLWSAVVTQATVSMISLVTNIGICTFIDYNPIDVITIYNSTRIGIVLIAQSLHIAAFLLLLRFRYIKPLQKRLWIALSIIPWVSVASLSTLMELSLEFPEYQKRILLSMLCIIIANVMTYYFFVVISKGHEARLELQMLEQQNENVKREMESSRAFVAEMRQVRHDIKNQLLTIQRYLDENKVTEASEYVKRLSGEYLPMRQSLVVTENVAFDAIVNAKAALCQPQGIDFIVRVKPEIVQKIDSVDVGILFGNLLDNAIEAAKNSKGKRIYMEVDQKEAYISIIVRNSIDASVLEKNPSLMTTKKNPDIHGVGLKSVHRLVEEHDGMIQFFEENNEFCCHILLKKKNE